MDLYNPPNVYRSDKANSLNCIILDQQTESDVNILRGIKSLRLESQHI